MNSSRQATFVVAVSGGVDSVVLLNLLAKQIKQLKVESKKLKVEHELYNFINFETLNLTSPFRLVVAHFDHGIRSNSARDRQFVDSLAKTYHLPFEYAEGKLGSKASEAKARQTRYAFLRRVQKKYRAQAIITAHHQDDVLETAIINLLRGTHRKGLSSLKSRPGVIRPLLYTAKLTIVSFAKKHDLAWREDPSNKDVDYLRNYIRHRLIPKFDRVDPNWRAQLLNRIERGVSLNADIDNLVVNLFNTHVSRSKSGFTMKRQVLVEITKPLAQELLAEVLRQSGAANLSSLLIKRAWLFSKTARAGAKLQLGKHIELTIEKGNVLVTTKTLL